MQVYVEMAAQGKLTWTKVRALTGRLPSSKYEQYMHYWNQLIRIEDISKNQLLYTAAILQSMTFYCYNRPESSDVLGRITTL